MFIVEHQSSALCAPFSVDKRYTSDISGEAPIDSQSDKDVEIE
ncbi:hypothetical protein [Alteromonas sp. KUL106]|nr:hypothetical protein [Alteromonas sp. KUL106]